MKIISVKELSKRWRLNYDGLYNEVVALDIPIFIETPEYFMEKFIPEYPKDSRPAAPEPEGLISGASEPEDRLPGASDWEIKWTRVSPDLLKFELFKGDNCPYFFRYIDIQDLEAKRIFTKDKLPTGMTLDEATAILNKSCDEISTLYENLKGIDHNAKDAPLKCMEKCIEVLESNNNHFEYLNKSLLEETDIYDLPLDAAKKVFTGKLLANTLKMYGLAGSIGTSDYKKTASLFLKIMKTK